VVVSQALCGKPAEHSWNGGPPTPFEDGEVAGEGGRDSGGDRPKNETRLTVLRA